MKTPKAVRYLRRRELRRLRQAERAAFEQRRADAEANLVQAIGFALVVQTPAAWRAVDAAADADADAGGSD